jgi:hypothetical protein
VAGVSTVEAGHVAVADEQRLDLALAEWAVTAAEEGILGPLATACEIAAEEGRRAGEQRLLGPGPALEALDNDPATLEVDVATREQRDLSYPKTVVVDQREECAIAKAPNRGEERSQLELCEIAGQALGRPDDAWQRRDEVRK